MTTLTDYVDAETLQQLQDIFTQVTRARLRVYGAGDKPVTSESDLISLTAEAPRQAANLSNTAPIMLAGKQVGSIVLEGPSQTRWPAEQMQALAEALNIPPAQLRQALRDLPDVDSEATDSARRMLELMAEVVRRLCRQQRDLSARVEELSTLYKLTALFAGHRNLDHVLDTVVTTVVAVMGVKASAIRLLDSSRKELTIRAVCGLSDEYLGKGKVLLKSSELDTEALKTGDVVYVEDERTDPRVLFPAAVKREGLVSALIAPLVYKGKRVGLLRLYTNELKRFSNFEIALVRAIAEQAAAAIVNAQLYAESIKAAETRRQLRLAAAVQRRMIPAAPPELPGVDLAAVYVPSLDLSGDFYDFIELPEDNLGLAICDVMGKGAGAAMLMAAIRASLRAHASDLYDVSEIIRRVNRSLCADTLTEAFATLFYGVINTRSMELTYVNAGHEPPILIREGRTAALTGDGMILGIEPGQQYARSLVQLQPSDVLLCATDGLIEAMNFDEEQFGQDRAIAAAHVAIDRGENANGIAKHILWEMRRFAGLQDRLDDITIVTLLAK